MWNSEYESNYLSHHGILGQKWGVRRFQNPDGSLTAKGKKRYTEDGRGLSRKDRQKIKDDLDSYTRKVGHDSGIRKLYSDQIKLETGQLKSLKVGDRIYDSNDADLALKEIDLMAALERKKIIGHINEKYGIDYDKMRQREKKQIEIGSKAIAASALLGLAAVEVLSSKRY